MEQKLIIELCKITGSQREIIERELNKEPDYSYVLGQLHMHRMAGAAYHVLKEHGLLGEINGEFRSSLRRAYQYNRFRNQGYAMALSMIADMLENADFMYTVLKGGVLCFVYPYGVRTAEDVDLLISRKDIPEVLEFFRREGFAQGFVENDEFVKATENVDEQLDGGVILPFVKRVGLPGLEFLEVNINFYLSEQSLEDSNTIDTMQQEYTCFAAGRGKMVHTLGREDFLIQLCVRLYKEATTYQCVELGRDLFIYRFSDIYLYYYKFIDRRWDDILAAKIYKYHLEMPCYYAFYYTGKLFETDIFDGILERISSGGDYKDVLNRVYNPVNKEMYTFQAGFMQRLFDGHRKKLLTEWCGDESEAG